MDIYDAVNNNFDNPDLEEYVKPGCYNVYFNGDDETQFDLYPGHTLSDLIDLWEVFSQETGLDENCVDSVSFIGPDEHMQAELKDIFKNGLAIIRDIDEEGENIYLSPDDIRYVQSRIA